jgi:hypothetical protein
MLHLWPETKTPQLFNALGTPYAWRAGLLRIENKVIQVRCETGENCGVNFWITNKIGVIQLRYTLHGAGGLYAIAVGDKREIADISRVGVQLEEGSDRSAHLLFRFKDQRVHEVVIGIRLNEGLPNARPIGELMLTQVELDEEEQPNGEPPVHSAWLVLVPVTTAATDDLEKTYKFVVTDMGTSPEAAEIVRGTSVENAIENSIERIVFSRVSHQQMFELRVSRTAFSWLNAQHIGRFLHAGREYEISELVDSH